MDLDPRQTAAVRAVIETGSFEQAAVRLNITSSAVSQRVRALETRLGNPLIVRTRPCRATQMGQRLLQYLRRAALLEDDFASDLAGANEALLNVAAACECATRLSTSGFFPALSEILLQENVLLDLTVDDQDHTHALLASGLSDWLHHHRTRADARLFPPNGWAQCATGWWRRPRSSSDGFPEWIDA